VKCHDVLVGPTCHCVSANTFRTVGDYRELSFSPILSLIEQLDRGLGARPSWLETRKLVGCSERLQDSTDAHRVKMVFSEDRIAESEQHGRQLLQKRSPKKAKDTEMAER